MNNERLNELLLSVAAPPVDPAVQEKACHRATLAFRSRLAEPASGRTWGLFARLACFAFAAVALLGFAVWHYNSSAKFPDSRLLAEMEALFPGQLNGVIASGGEVHLDVAAQAAPFPTFQPLAVTLRRGRHVVKVLGYSGRKVCVNLDGRPRCLEPLATPNGQVIVEGDDFLWSKARPVRVAGYRVEAHSL